MTEEEAPPFRSTEAVPIGSHSRWIAGLVPSAGLLAFVLALTSVAEGVAAGGLIPVMAAMLGSALIGTGPLLARWWDRRALRRAPPTGVELRADRTGIHHGGQLLISRAQIRDVDVSDAEGVPLVTVQRDGGAPIRIRVPDGGAGERLRSAIGFGATQSVARFVLRGQGLLRPGRYAWAFGVGFLLASCAWMVLVATLLRQVLPGLALGPAMVLPFVPLVLAAMVPLRVKVGIDGVVLDPWARRGRFVPFTSVERIETTATGVELHLTSGGSEAFHIPVPKGQAASRYIRTHPLVTRLHAAFESYRTREAEPSAEVLARGGRDAAEWARSLRALGRGRLDYRAGALSRERLWGIVGDARAEPTLRAGAAVALGANADEADKQRLRIAAEATAQPTLRVALEAATAEDEAALVEAMDAIEADRRESTS